MENKCGTRENLAVYTLERERLLLVASCPPQTHIRVVGYTVSRSRFVLGTRQLTTRKVCRRLPHREENWNEPKVLR